MFRYAFMPSRRIPALFAILLGFAVPVAANAAARVSESYGKLPLHFEANQGQAHENVRFLTRGSGYSLYLTPGEAVFVLAKPNPDKKRERHGKRDWESKHERPKTQAMVLRMAIVGADPAPLVSGLEGLSGKVNYFIGNDPAKWRTNVPTYAKVHYRGVYPGIDLVYYGNQRQLEYDFLVAPGADPRNIVLDFRGADRLEIDAQGDLVLHLAGGALRQKKPVIYQEVDGIRREIAGGYVLQGTNRVGFEVAAYDRSRPLVIDPVLSYSTFLGGSGGAYGSGIAVDADGNAYVTGWTGSSDFPITPGAFQPTDTSHVSSWVDTFVTKLDPTGSALVYSTYLGGSDGAMGFGIAVDAGGNAHVTGHTGSRNFPTTPGAFQPAHAGSNDAFVTKLNPTGSGLVYSSYLGGTSEETGYGIALDADGNAYVTGSTESTTFPTTPGAFRRTIDPFVTYVFVTKVNPTGSALVYSTFLGAAHSAGIAVDADGNAYVTGNTNSTNYPTTSGAFQTTGGGAFVTKLHSTGSALVYSTYLGGRGGESGMGIAVDADGNAYVTGWTTSVDFPTTIGAFQTILGGGLDGDDAFVTKLNPTGSAPIYSTFLGGWNSDGGTGIAVDGDGNAYVTGRTSSSNFPTTAGAVQPGQFGSSDAFVTKLNPTGTKLIYSTFLGDDGYDAGFGIAVNAAGSYAYVTGLTNSNKFPTTPGAFQSMIGSGSGNGVAFVARISDAPGRYEESVATYMGYWPTHGAEIGAFSGGTIVASDQTMATASFTFTGTAVNWIGVRCDICGIATVSVDGGAPTVVNTAGPGSGHLTSEPVFSVSGLAPDVGHTIVITVTGRTTTAGAHIAVDAFDVTR